MMNFWNLQKTKPIFSSSKKDIPTTSNKNFAQFCTKPAPARLRGKDPFRNAGEMTGMVMHDGIRSQRQHRNLPDRALAPNAPAQQPPPRLVTQVPNRLRFCVGCPERPFAQQSLLNRNWPTSHRRDIGCHLFPPTPLDIGATTMGYGLGAAPAAAFNDKTANRRSIHHRRWRFWHNDRPLRWNAVLMTMTG